MDKIEELARFFERFPGIGPRQAKRFVYHLLSAAQVDRQKMSEIIASIGSDVRQCSECMRFSNGTGKVCTYCADASRDSSLLLIVEKDQDLSAVERTGTYKGKYFVLGGVLTLSGKGVIREKELLRLIEIRTKEGLSEVVLALSATSEGENTADHLRNALSPYRGSIKLTLLGRGLSTGSELEYSDKETLTSALMNRKET